MKKLISIIGCIILVCFCIFFLKECSLMYGDSKLYEGDLSFVAHRIFPECFVSTYAWTSGETYAALDIPEFCEGYRVTALGGFIGSGGPCPFMVDLPGTVSIYTEDTLPENAMVEQYHLTIHIGKSVREDDGIEMDVYYYLGADRFVQILTTVHCAPDNPAYYTLDGKLYRKSDNSLVEGFFYESDTHQ